MLYDLIRGIGDLGSWAKYELCTFVFELCVVAGWDDSSCHEDDVTSALLVELLLESWNESEMSSGQAACANNVNIVVNGLPGNFGWR